MADCQHSVTSCSLGNVVSKIRPRRNSNEFDQAVRSIPVLSKMFPLILQKHSRRETDQVLGKHTSVLVVGLKETLTFEGIEAARELPHAFHMFCLLQSELIHFTLLLSVCQKFIFNLVFNRSRKASEYL